MTLSPYQRSLIISALHVAADRYHYQQEILALDKLVNIAAHCGQLALDSKLLADVLAAAPLSEIITV